MRDLTGIDFLDPEAKRFAIMMKGERIEEMTKISPCVHCQEDSKEIGDDVWKCPKCGRVWEFAATQPFCVI